MTFAEKLRDLREKHGLSEAKLAKAAGLPFGTLHNYVLGTRTPSFPAVLKLSRALGVTCEAFAECEDLDGKQEAERPAKKQTKPDAAKEKKPRGRARKEK